MHDIDSHLLTVFCSAMISLSLSSRMSSRTEREGSDATCAKCYLKDQNLYSNTSLTSIAT